MRRVATEAEPAGQFYVLTASVLLMLIASGSMFLVVVALKPIAQEFGWPRAIPSLAFSFQFIGSGLGGMVMGRLLDRFGMGAPACIAAVMIGAGTIAMSGIDAAWQLYLIYAVMIGFLGMGATAAPAMANITRWYHKRRGMAVGMVAGGQSLAGILWPPVFGYLIDAQGWREAALGYGVFALVMMLPLAFVLRHHPPAPRPLSVPDGTTGGAIPASAGPAALPISTRGLQISLSFAIVGCCVAMALPLGHLVSYVTDLGHPIGSAVEVLSMLLMASFVSRAIFVGLLADNLGGLRALFLFCGIQAATLGAFTAVHGLVGLYVVAALFGFGYGGIFPVYTYTIREHMPFMEAGRRTGAVLFFGALGMAFGSWLGGALFDATGSYVPAFLTGVAFNVANLAVVGSLILRARRPLAAAAVG